MTETNVTTTTSSDAEDYEQVEDVEISAGGVYIDHTDADDRVYIVQGVGDVTEFAADGAIPPEHRERVERQPEAVLVKSDKNGPTEKTALDARVFRRLVFQGALQRVESTEGNT